MIVDDPYQTPPSTLEGETPDTPLSRLDEGMIEYMRASRPRNIVFTAIGAMGSAASAAGMVVFLLPITADEPASTGDMVLGATVLGVVLAHCAFATLALWRYVTAINRVARTSDKRDLESALRARAWARVGFFMIIVLMFCSLSLPVFLFG